jgi:transglutaminase-like putative cysteine protease
MILSYGKNTALKVIIIVILCVVFLPVFGNCEVIILKDGTRIEKNVIKKDDKKLYLFKGGDIDKKDVKEIYFSVKEHKTKEKKEVDDELIKEIMEEADKFEKKYPDYNGLTLLDDGFFEYNEDGSNIYRYHYRYKVLKDIKKSEASVSFYFNEGRERINILLARTISPDGDVFNLDPSKINISKPTSGTRSFTRYNTFSFMLPNVEVGSIIEYKIEIDEYNPFEKRFFFPNFGFKGHDPILLSRLTVTIPKSEELYYVFKNFDDEHEKPEVSRHRGTKSYVWKYENVEPMISEPNMPAYRDIVPFITCSLFDDWNIFFNWTKGFLEKKIAVTDEIENKVEQITKGCSTDEERVAKIYYFIQQKIRYISIKSGIGSGYSGHPATETLNNEYGDCIDKAILFTTMLNVLDIPSYPIFVKTNDSNDVERRLPSFDSNHAITKVLLNGEEIFLDSTAENYRYPYFQSADHGIWVINPLQQKFEYIPTPPPEDNAVISKSFGSINKKGDFEIDTTKSFAGPKEASQRYYTKHVKNVDLKRYMKNYINSLSPGSQLKYYVFVNSEDYSKPLYFDIGYKLENYGITAGDLVILSIPAVEKSYREVALEKRKYPLEFTTSYQDKREFVIDLMGNYKVRYLPNPVHINTKYFSYDMEYKEDNGKIIFTEDYKRKKREVPLSDYDTYRMSHKEIERRLKDKIFLTRVE